VACTRPLHHCRSPTLSCSFLLLATTLPRRISCFLDSVCHLAFRRARGVSETQIWSCPQLESCSVRKCRGRRNSSIQ
jgi:hypothetical protein